jgi:hypothetical protein
VNTIAKEFVIIDGEYVEQHNCTRNSGKYPSI